MSGPFLLKIFILIQVTVFERALRLRQMIASGKPSYIGHTFPPQQTKTIKTNCKLLSLSFLADLSDNIFFGADLQWKIDMHSLDLDAAHPVKFDSGITLRPSFGIKASNIKQTINVDWDADVYTSTEKVEQKYLGLGPTIGIDGRFNFYKQFSFVGSVSAAFMWGKWDVKDVYNRPSALGGIVTPTTITTEMNDSELGTLMLDYKLGIQWQHSSGPNIAVDLNYEMQYWANQLRMVTFQQLPEHGDLTYQGVTCGIHIYF